MKTSSQDNTRLLGHDEIARLHHAHATVELEHTGLRWREVHCGNFTRRCHTINSETSDCDEAASARVRAFNAEVEVHGYSLLDFDYARLIASRVTVDYQV